MTADRRPRASAKATLANALAAAAIGLSVVALVAAVVYPSWYAGFIVAILALCSSVPLVGAAAARSFPRNPVGWLLLAVGISLPIVLTAHLVRLAVPGTPVLVRWLEGWPATLAVCTVPLVVMQLYPDGRPVTRRWRWLVAVGVVILAMNLVGDFFAPQIWGQDVANPTGLSGIPGTIALAMAATLVLTPVVATLSAVTASIRRRRTADPAVALAAAAGWVVAASWWVCLAVSLVSGDSEGAVIPELLGLAAVGIAGWVGIRRFGAFDTRVVVSRGVVATLLGACVLAVYLGVAWIINQIVASRLGDVIAVLAAVAVALPLWQVLQRWVTRLLYGDRDEPARALRRLSDRIVDATELEALLPEAVETVREVLRLPAVRLTAGRIDVGAFPAGAESEEFPIVFAGERIGELTVALRDDHEGFRPAERAVLQELAAQISGATRAVALSADLRASRERLVNEIEQERRRISRDLHDGLGARLGGLVLGLKRAGRAIPATPEAAVDQLDVLTDHVRDALAEVRRLVYALRPPALDELGLLGAVQEQISRLARADLIAPSPLGALPAAVEVAAYRIAVEALTNVARHAPDATTTVQIDRTEDSLLIQVADSGPGLPDGYRPGVGISSMRERATDLDGTFELSRSAEGGTLVRAVLPMEHA